ncbi:MAG: acyl-CoA synthetase, partial [Woeseia sp.]|nr:acyl-CoA synthetase [Woeseia sp.]
MHPSAHLDTFTRDNLPDKADWPELTFDLPATQYPPQLNCAVELVDRQVDAGHADRMAILGQDEAWTYTQLAANINRIANILVSDLGVVPGNR